MSIRRNSLWMLAARVLRTGVAAGYFLLLARSLGPSGYGAFATVCAFAGILAPFASLGTGNLLVEAVARDPRSFPEHWARCLVVTTASGTALIALALLTGRFALPRTCSIVLLAFIAIAELLFARLLDVSAMAFQAIERLHVTATLTILLSVSRMIAASFLLLFSQADATLWAGLYLLATAIPALLALVLVSRTIGRPRFRLSFHPRDLRRGLYFSASLSAQSIYNDLDKTMLANLSGLAAAGIYSAAYRVIDASFSPVSSVLAATYARFFQRGADGIHHSLAFARRVLRPAALYAIAAAAGLWIASPLFPRLLGRSFAEALPALRWLSPLLLLRSLHYFAADSLTGAGYQCIRTTVQVGVAFLNIVLNLAVLPRYSWHGAVWTSLACDGVLAAVLWIIVWHLSTHERVAVPQAAMERA